MSVVDRLYETVVTHEFKLPNFIVPVWGKADAVRVANLLRNDGYTIELKEVGFLCWLNISNPPHRSPR